MADNILIKDATGTNITVKTKELAGAIQTPFHINAGSNGVEAGVTQYGHLRITPEPMALFNETFDTLDTTARWTTKLATGTAAVSNGALALSSSTTASAYGGVFTQPTFAPNGLNFLVAGQTQTIPNVVQANTLRFWGWGSVQTTPTVAAPIVNGVGFELDGAGVLYAVVYQNGVRGTGTNVVTIGSVLTNNVPFLTAIARRADSVDFYVNNQLVPVASIAIPQLFVATLPYQMICINGAVAPAAAAQLNVLAFGIGDTGINSQSIGDGVFPWRKATVKAASTAAVAADPSLVVSLSPNNPITIAAAQTLATVTTVTTCSTLTGGSAAEDAATTTNPHIVGGIVRTAVAPTTLVAGDAARLTMTKGAAAVVMPYASPDTSWSYAAAAGGILNTTTAVTIKAAGAALVRNHITSIQVQSEALTNATELAIRDGAGGTVLWRIKIPTTGLPGTTFNFNTPLRGTAATLLEVVTLTASGAGAVYFNAQGFESA